MNSFFALNQGYFHAPSHPGVNHLNGTNTE